jgi:vacuolar iron transporter family protein
MDPKDRQRFLDNWNDEQNGAAIYLAMADFEKDPQLSQVYRKMGEVELKHARKWEHFLKAGGEKVPEFKQSWRTRTLISLARRFGPALILPGIQASEQKGTQGYKGQAEAQDMAADESSHARILNQISGSGKGGMAGASLALLEGRHRATGGNALRAAVLGANDGLVSNLSLVMGVAGAELAGNGILVTGIAGLLAGACSMALGEWLSVQSSRELYANQIRIEKEEIEMAPAEEAEELALIYQSRGLEPEQARALADQIMSDKEHAIDALARDELGINPEELGGSAWEAAITSFLLFAAGAVIPVIPFMFLTGTTAVLVSIVLATIGLFAIGAATSLFTGQKLLFSGMRMVIFGLIAAAITFGIGRLIGVTIGG